MRKRLGNVPDFGLVVVVVVVSGIVVVVVVVVGRSTMNVTLSETSTPTELLP